MTQRCNPDDAARAELARGRASDPWIKVDDIAYVVQERRDLDRAERFMTDFGLLRAGRTEGALYLRPSGASACCWIARKAAPGARARFVGFGLRAACARDLDKVARLPGASPVGDVEAPGGGRRVVLRAPNGAEVHVIHGATEATPLPIRPPLALNHIDDKPRTNAAQRPALAPAEVARLGHLAIQTPHFSRMVLWLMRTFGMIVSDYQDLMSMPEPSPVAAFLRCDRGAAPADHHTLAIAAGPAEALEHAAFEVQDLDALAMGGEYMKHRGWTRAWGIGRHRLGSQIFDYWRDPGGGMLEHFADGDVFDASHEVARSPFDGRAQAQWGPDMPAAFIDASLSPRRILQALRAVQASDDLSVRKLLAMKRALATRSTSLVAARDAEERGRAGARRLTGRRARPTKESG